MLLLMNGSACFGTGQQTRSDLGQREGNYLGFPRAPSRWLPAFDAPADGCRQGRSVRDNDLAHVEIGRAHGSLEPRANKDGNGFCSAHEAARSLAHRHSVLEHRW